MSFSTVANSVLQYFPTFFGSRQPWFVKRWFGGTPSGILQMIGRKFGGKNLPRSLKGAAASRLGTAAVLYKKQSKGNRTLFKNFLEMMHKFVYPSQGLYLFLQT